MPQCGGKVVSAYVRPARTGMELVCSLKAFEASIAPLSELGGSVHGCIHNRTEKLVTCKTIGVDDVAGVVRNRLLGTVLYIAAVVG